jgi:hypothetical protein
VLERGGIRQIVALFMLSPEYGDWRFVLSSPSLDQTHLLKAHEKVYELLKGRFIDSLPLLMVLPTKDPFIRELRKILGKAKSVTGMRLGGQTIGNRFIDNAYVYQIQ